MSMQMLDGTWSSAASFGISQSSLTGQETYSANAMIWSNLKQFSLGVSKSKVHLWREYEGVTYLVNPITSKQTLARLGGGSVAVGGTATTTRRTGATAGKKPPSRRSFRFGDTQDALSVTGGAGW